MSRRQPEPRPEGERGPNEAPSIIDASKVLANRTRVDIFRALAESSGEKRVLDVASELELDESTISRALNALRTIGLARRRVAKNHHFYSVAEEIEITMDAQQLHFTIPCRDGELSLTLNRTQL